MSPRWAKLAEEFVDAFVRGLGQAVGWLVVILATILKLKGHL